MRARQLLTGSTAVALAFCIAAYFIVLSGQDRLSYFLGQTLTHPVFSRVHFERVNQLRTDEVRRKSQQEVPNYFRPNEILIEDLRAQFRELLAAVNAAESFETFAPADRKQWDMDAAAFDALNKLTDEKGSERYNREIERILERLLAQDMIRRADLDAGREFRGTSNVVQLRRGDDAFEAVPMERLIYAVNADHVERAAATAVDDALDPAVRPVLTAMIRRAIAPGGDSVNPVYVIDSELTRRRIEEAGHVPPVMDSYASGDRLVAPGVIDGETLTLLNAENEAYLEARKVDAALMSQWRRQRTGLFGLIVLLTAGLAAHTVYYERRVATNTTRAFALAALLLLMLLLDRLIFVGMGASPVWSVATIAMTAAILTLAYSQAFAVGATLILSLLTTLTLEARLGLLLVHSTVIAFAVLLLQDIRTRLRMVEVGLFTAFAAALAEFFVGLSYQEGVGYILPQASFAALAAFAGISIVLVLLPVIERLFRITTSLTLLEWADTSNPLLRQLIERAPGTWQHSHLLGSMAEAAAEEIGANGLLVRVGAYYHDIGKMLKPQYFVENQQGKSSAHQRLAPTMSLLVILAHVKDGLAMAREHHVPRVLHPFIAEHHGTTVVRYFHARAAAEARAGGRSEKEVSETEFRYPGPKPRSRESAILMFCDGVEGAVRSIAEPTPSRIEAVVHEIFINRLMDGQFDDCEITLKELARVEQSLVKSLRAFHHGRIAYPKSGESQPIQVRTA